MQDPTTITAFQLVQTMNPILHHNFSTEQEQQQQLKCPRCDSTNTKFCYYNNYNLSQPRHFCKNCRRYWTKGGALRNIPVGGGSRKTNKKSSSSTSSTKRQVPPPPPPSSSNLVSSSASHTATVNVSRSDMTRMDQERGVMNTGGSFSPLLGSSGNFGTLFEGLNSNGPGMKMVQMGGFGGNFGSDSGLNSGSGRNPGLDMQSNGVSEGFLAMQNGDDNGGGHGWSELTMYTHGSRFR